MLDMRSYRALVALERSLAISRRLRALRPRALASLVFREVARAAASAEAAALFSSMRSLSLPRARLEEEKRASETRTMRLRSEDTRRLTRSWLALREMTSPVATAISPTRRDSTFLVKAVTEAIWVAKSLRSCFTWPAAWARAAPRSLTVLAKRESARAACLASESLRPATAAPSFSEA